MHYEKYKSRNKYKILSYNGTSRHTKQTDIQKAQWSIYQCITGNIKYKQVQNIDLQRKQTDMWKAQRSICLAQDKACRTWIINFLFVFSMETEAVV